MVLKLLDGGGGSSGGFGPFATEHKRHEQIGNLAVELKHQRVASEPSAMVPRENQCHIAESASLDAILDFLESVTEEYEMNPEQRYTLIRVKKRGYWEPLDDPNPRKSNGKRSATIINASSFF
uniref:Uncharacterized protein n=1 Tax=Oryza glaberrima TaxID=4538 RepID=I1QRS3_ORYGL